MPNKPKPAPAKRAKKVVKKEKPRAKPAKKSTLMLVDIPLDDQKLLTDAAEKNGIARKSKKVMAERVLLQFTARMDGRKLTLFK